jgi:hypothetical protein
MAEARKSSRDLQMLSANAHTAESFGRAIIGASLAAAADKAAKVATRGPIKMELNVTVTQIPGGLGAWVCVGIPDFGTFCKLERQD